MSPHQRFTLISASSGARTSGEIKPYSKRINPSSANKNPMGRRRSSMVLPEQNVKYDEHREHDYGQRPRALVPRMLALVRQIRHAIDKIMQIRFGFRLGRKTDNIR